MYHWRNAVMLGITFIVVGLIYYWIQGPGATMDLTGATLLVATGLAMGAIFVVLLRGSGEL